MKKILSLLIILILSLSMLQGCKMSYTTSEREQIQEKLASYENGPNFALWYSRSIWLAEKTVRTSEITFNGEEISDFFGCGDKYFYLSTRSKISSNNYTMHLLKVDYNSLEMIEFGCVENLTEGHSSTTMCGNKLYIKDDDMYCIYNIDNGKQEWRKYNSEEFWEEQKSKYSFEITDGKNDSIVKITDNITGIEKSISWKNDLTRLEAGKYIRELEEKLSYVDYSGFVNAKEENGICYLVGMIPLSLSGLDHLAFVLAYNFDSEEISFCKSMFYGEYNTPKFTIVEM